MGDLLAPLQLGYGTSMGAEAAVHAARTYLHSMPDDHLLLKVDFSNAFNSIRRDMMLQACLQLTPEIYPLVHSAYVIPSFLFFGNNIIDSSEGVQQGDPLGPLQFSLTIHSMLIQLQSEFKVFYLDDGTLGGSHAEVMKDLQCLEVAANDPGLILNHSKTEIVCRDPSTVNIFWSLSPHFRWVEPSNACLLGSPIGDLSSIDSTLLSKLDALKTMGERLSLLHSQDALLLLRNAFSLPKVLYVLQTAPCFESTVLNNFDHLQRKLLESICNVQLDDNAWTQASLPITAGGLGIRSFTRLAPSAFLASAAGSSQITKLILPASLREAPIHHQPAALVLWRASHNAEAPSGQITSHQKAWDTPLVEASLAALMENSAQDPKSKARLLAVQRKESGAWLTALPASSLGLRMEDDAVRVAVGLRLGLSLCVPHRCTQCGVHVDSSGTHGLSCRKSRGRHPCHAALNSIIKRALSAADIPSILEPVGLCRTDGKRADSVTVIPWKRGQSLAWDVTCWDTLAPSYILGAASEPGKIANQAESRKNTIYNEIAQSHYFVAIGFESLGVFGDCAMSFLKELSHRIRLKTADPQSFHHLCQSISITIQRFNSVAILGSSVHDLFI